MADLHHRLVDLFATEFVVHRAGAGDPNVAAAERVLDVVAAEIRAEVAAEIRAQAEQIVGRARAMAGMPAAGDDHPWMLGMHFATRIAEGNADGR